MNAFREHHQDNIRQRRRVTRDLQAFVVAPPYRTGPSRNEPDAVWKYPIAPQACR
jgi:hypothetical protein